MTRKSPRMGYFEEVINGFRDASEASIQKARFRI